MWFYFRHYLNLSILYSIAAEYSTVGPFAFDWETDKSTSRFSQGAIFALLAALQGLPLFWLFCLLRTAVRFVILGIVKDDTSDVEESEVEDGNAAYDSLEDDADTAELVKSYVKTLMIASDIDSSTDLSAELKDPIQRQVHMRELVEKGQAKIFTPSKITKGVGDVAQFILSAKPILDAAIQNIPQAALPWAGRLAGIVHVVSQMDWYCALSEHLLKKDHVDESLESIPPLLQVRVIALYKALLLYQIKSVCSYYRHQGLVFLR
ncbi:hypothetical protein N657DRAFT_683414 [Parathielavia appendiculata]|uniref:NWD NACHT-NTPase N-terminal domain-containing protein n=1 Tax=Parathielavia appendiculata TaxID=2587402 RepID=A0AAN6Z071_9PEZI|nr:hypothetical protein N657DRAFT_683414 [Parathielavia appendiculata]